MNIDTQALLKAAQRFEHAKALRRERPPIATAERRDIEAALAEPSSEDAKLRDAEDGHRARFLYPEERLAYERRIGSDDLKPIRYLELGLLAARAVARVVVPNVDPRGDMLGTGFLVAPGLFVTNHHVLAEPYWAKAARVEFGAEDDLKGRPRRSHTYELDPDNVYFADEELDFAVVAIKPRSLSGAPIGDYGYIRVFLETGKIREGEYANVIQHPSGRQKEISVRNNRIVVLNPDGTAPDAENNFLYYEADTEGGSSGSPVFNDQWYLVALHRRGVPRTKIINGRPVVMRKDRKPARPDDPDAVIDYIANEGVRASRIIRHITEAVEAGNPMARKVYECWREVRAAPLDGPLPFLEAANAAPSAGHGLIVVSDLEVTVRPLSQFAGASGYDLEFLGAAHTVSLPDLSSETMRDTAPLASGEGVVLDYDNFSVVMNARRRLPFYAAWNIDGDKLFHPGERPRWGLDPRLKAEFQPDDVIFSQELQRGHVVRRMDVVWGDRGRRAHVHTFCLTNVLPQVRDFNNEEWGDLEDHILQNADAADARVSVFAGPIFSAEDPFYDDLRRRTGGPRPPRTGMRIPLLNWKIVAWVSDGRLKAAGFIRDQREELQAAGPLELSFGGTVQKQTLIRRIEERTGLIFGDLAGADTLAGEGVEERVLARRSDAIL
ncbi:MAG: DNA/RNA non-specific endonuclease [Hyphomicrobiales bacterium]|nr:DNA/RNA non-specific endonuclease [Hyphomicrobiales bacterium]